jgi:hypothetical protein
VEQQHLPLLLLQQQALMAPKLLQAMVLQPALQLPVLLQR